jgi:hypothetical protein
MILFGLTSIIIGHFLLVLWYTSAFNQSFYIFPLVTQDHIKEWLFYFEELEQFSEKELYFYFYMIMFIIGLLFSIIGFYYLFYYEES